MPKQKALTRNFNSSSELTKQAEADAIFLSMGDGAITTDEFGRITRVNPAATKILGFSEKELIGKPFLKAVTAYSLGGAALTVIDRPITKAYLTGRVVETKLYVQSKKGSLIPASVSVSPIMVDGKPIGAIEVFRDISMELEVDRMKSEFISLASHQLRTPLSAVKTYTHMLRDSFMGPLNSDQKKALDTIINASNRMNELISTLLNITRIESGTITVTPKATTVEEIVKDIMPELKLMAESKKIQLVAESTKGSETKIRTDILILKEIINNIISNSIKYTPVKGWVKIVTKAGRTKIHIEISDNGWGIPTQNQNQVFSKFFRGPNIIRRETSGTGLGLYLVKGLVESIDGEIDFKSEEGKGTTFYITLPRSLSIKNRRTRKIKLE
ncbi:MAG TPA: PAS domain-containing sensor histidine kinase [Candidatus Sulfotelmatobacter sp.]|nr:PAS domain-containing sensor histidine kinase [Candidatus Sulfotelmatobacter sp.]